MPDPADAYVLLQTLVLVLPPNSTAVLLVTGVTVRVKRSTGPEIALNRRS